MNSSAFSMTLTCRSRDILAIGFADDGHAAADSQKVVGQRLDLAVAGIGNLAARKHAEPRLPYARAISDLTQGPFRSSQLPAHEIKGVHSRSIRQNSAICKRQDLWADKRQHLAVPKLIEDHRALLRENLSAWMKDRGVTRKTLKAHYIQGPKAGKPVSERSVANMLSADPHANSPSYDMIVAVCAKLGIMPWHLLTPGRGPADPPRLVATEEERKLHRSLERDYAKLQAKFEKINRSK